jgi:predicted dehydrogenase
MRKIKTILIGMGNIGYSNDLNKKTKIQSHYKALCQNRYINLIGVVEKKKIDLVDKKINVFKNLNEIVSINFELAVIAVPTEYHFNILKFLINLKHPKAIICEKPFTDEFKKAEDIIFLSKKNKKKIYVNYFRRSIPSFLKLLKYLNKFKASKKMNIFYSKSLLRNGCHFIDFAQFLFGKVQFHRYDKIKSILYLKSKNSLITLNFLKKKQSENSFEIFFEDKIINVDMNSKIYEKKIMLKNSKFKQIFKKSRAEMDIFQKLSLNNFIKHYLKKSKRSKLAISSNKVLLNTLNIIKKTKQN